MVRYSRHNTRNMETITNEEKKKHVRRIIDVLDGLGPVETLDVIGLACITHGYTIATAGTLTGKERQQEILSALTKHLEGIRESIYTLCATSIFGGESESPKDKADSHEG